MEKIVIIGSPGAGKTTLAKALGSMLNIGVVHLDRLFWRRGWEKKSRGTRIDILHKRVREKQWVIEGTYLNSSKLHLHEADTVIFLDIPPLVCLERIIKRHLTHRGRFRRDLPEGCTDRLTPFSIVKVLTFPLGSQRTLERNLRNYPSKNIIRLRSTKEVKDFLARQKQEAVTTVL